MNKEQQLKLQAFCDDELSESEAREVTNWIATDPEAAALHTELKNTRQALSNYETEIKLPESREFYWSKIEREIRKQEEREELRPVEAPFARFWRFLVPVGSVAALLLIGLVAVKNFNSPGIVSRAGLETALADSGAMTYRDEQEGMTVVWLSYEN